MVERLAPVDSGWAAVDRMICDTLLSGDAALDAALAANAAAGLPDIDVSPAQGKMLHLLARMASAQRILEIGTLGGYSTVWLARGRRAGGRLITLEIDPHHAKVARENVAQAGLADRVEVREGPAIDTLTAMQANGERPFDLIFIDADKSSNLAYFSAAVALSRAGTAIIVDNVVREGGILDADSQDARIIGTRALINAVATMPGISATVVQTVGAKKWDGFLLALVGDIR